MQKKVLVISSSARVGGNSDTLCTQFMEGAQIAGHNAERVSIHQLNIGFCRACYACKKTGLCVQKDDMNSILDKMVEADIIVLATPVYFYTMSGQMKTFIDRALPRYYTDVKISDKDFYFIATAAEGKETMTRTIDGLRGFTDCLPNAKVKGIIYGAEAWHLGDIEKNKAMEIAFDMGKAIG